jgi:hypothetical protein
MFDPSFPSRSLAVNTREAISRAAAAFPRRVTPIEAALTDDEGRRGHAVMRSDALFFMSSARREARAPF